MTSDRHRSGAEWVGLGRGRGELQLGHGGRGRVIWYLRTDTYISEQIEVLTTMPFVNRKLNSFVNHRKRNRSIVFWAHKPVVCCPGSQGGIVLHTGMLEARSPVLEHSRAGGSSWGG